MILSLILNLKTNLSSPETDKYDIDNLRFIPHRLSHHDSQRDSEFFYIRGNE